MASVQRVVIVDPTEETRENLRNTLVALDSVYLEAECARYEFFPDVVKQSEPNLAIVTVDDDPEAAVALIRKMAAEAPGMNLIAASGRADGQFILKVIRAGAKEFLALPVDLAELQEIFRRLRGDGGGGGDESQVYAFAGSRGGSGVTSLATNFGCNLARDEENSVALVDLDLTLGDADVCLDIVPDYTLTDVAQNIDRIDLQLLKRSLSRHDSGLHLLPHPVQIDDAQYIQAEHVARVVHLLRMAFTHVILDLSKGFNAIDFASMAAADEILLVTQLDVSSLRNVVRIMPALNAEGNLGERVTVVANKVGGREGEIDAKRAEETIDQTIEFQIPYDSKTMMGARKNGVPLYEHAPKSRLYQAVADMTHALAYGDAEAAGEPAKSKKGFFSWG